MAEYFSPTTAATDYRGRPRTSLPVALDIDLQLVVLRLKTYADLARLRHLTRRENGRLRRQELTADICVAAQAGVMETLCFDYSADTQLIINNNWVLHYWDVGYRTRHRGG